METLKLPFFHICLPHQSMVFCMEDKICMWEPEFDMGRPNTSMSLYDITWEARWWPFADIISKFGSSLERERWVDLPIFNEKYMKYKILKECPLAQHNNTWDMSCLGPSLNFYFVLSHSKFGWIWQDILLANTNLSQIQHETY